MRPGAVNRAPLAHGPSTDGAAVDRRRRKLLHAKHMSDDYEKIRAFVAKALDWRQHGELPDHLRPSAYWSDFCKYSQYVRKLPPEELRNIRYHSWHLTGENYQTYYFAPEWVKQSVLEEYSFLRGRLKSDQVFNDGTAGIGFDSDHGRISLDVVRHMLVLVELCDHARLSSTSPQTILEIGGGYGGLASQCMTFNPRIAYVIVDLEETMFYQAVNLSNRFGAERVALYDFEQDRCPEIRSGRFHLIPQSKADALLTTRFDLAINQQSMQEMTAPQVERYCSLLSRTTKLFYSSNLPHHAQQIRDEKGTVENLNALLMRKFPVLWDSYADRPMMSRLASQWLPSAVVTMGQVARSYLGRSPAIAKRYRRLTGEPLRRFSDAALQRLVLATSTEPMNALAKSARIPV